MKSSTTAFFSILFLLFCHTIQAQDSLFTQDGKATAVKIMEVNTDNIKYKKASNLDGPVYAVEKSTVTHIKYQNGEDEVYQKSEVVHTVTSIPAASPTSKKTGYDITVKGRKVYLNISDDELPGLKNELKNELDEWNYWQIVHTKEEADFMLQVTTKKKAMNLISNTEVTSRAYVKSIDGETIWESEDYSSYASMYNGYDALHASVKRLVKKGLAKKFN